MTIAEACKFLGVSERTLYRYIKKGCPTEGVKQVNLGDVQQWMLDNGYTGAMGRSPLRAVPAVPGPVATVKTVRAPPAPSASPTPEDVEHYEDEIYQEVMNSENPAKQAILLHKVEQAGITRAKRQILQEEWLPRQAVERVQSEQAAALRKRLLSFPDRVAPRVVGRDEKEVREVLEKEILSILKQWNETGVIDD